MSHRTTNQKGIHKMTETNNIEMKKLNIDNLDQIMEFDLLCFPADHWKEEDWKDLLADERAT